MDAPHNHEIITLSKSFELNCNTPISSWIYSSQFIIMGTISGSLILYNKSDPSKRSILAFPELMETITSITMLNGRTNDLLLGTKKGSLALVSFQFSKDNITDQVYRKLLNLQEEIIDIVLHLNQSILVCTTKQLLIIRYDSNPDGSIKILEKQKLFESENDIIQLNVSKVRVLVSTWKSYFVGSIFGEEFVQVGSKEKQGLHGATFFQEETGLVVYAGRPQGRLWKANIATGKVLNTLQFSSEDGQKLNIGKLKDFDKYILSYNEDNLAIFDPSKNEILKEQRFSGPFLPLFFESHLNLTTERNSKNQKSRFFSLLFQENDKITIKECKICDINEAFNDCFANEDIDEAIRMFIKYGDLWCENNLDMIFQNKDKISESTLLEDPALLEIIDKIEEQICGPSMTKKPTLDDFEGLEVTKISSGLFVPIEETDAINMLIRSQIPVSSKKLRFSAVCIGTNIVRDQKMNLEKANEKLRRLTDEMKAKSELIRMINLYNQAFGGDNPITPTQSAYQVLVRAVLSLESEKLLAIIFNEKPTILSYCPRFLLSMHINRHYTENCSLLRLEQLNTYVQKQIKKDSIKHILGTLLLKQRLYGFLNSHEKALIKYYNGE